MSKTNHLSYLSDEFRSVVLSKAYYKLVTPVIVTHNLSDTPFENEVEPKHKYTLPINSFLFDLIKNEMTGDIIFKAMVVGFNHDSDLTYFREGTHDPDVTLSVQDKSGICSFIPTPKQKIDSNYYKELTREVIEFYVQPEYKL